MTYTLFVKLLNLFIDSVLKQQSTFKKMKIQTSLGFCGVASSRAWGSTELLMKKKWHKSAKIKEKWSTNLEKWENQNLKKKKKKKKENWEGKIGKKTQKSSDSLTLHLLTGASYAAVWFSTPLRVRGLSKRHVGSAMFSETFNLVTRVSLP